MPNKGQGYNGGVGGTLGFPPQQQSLHQKCLYKTLKPDKLTESPHNNNKVLEKLPASIGLHFARLHLWQFDYHSKLIPLLQ